MNTKVVARSFGLLGAVASLAAMAAGCQHRNADINRVQPGYVRKAIFQTGDEWYYRRTLAKSEVTNAYAIEGSGDIPLDRIRFRIEENVLLAVRPYEAIPGTQKDEVPGVDEFDGSVLAAWPILSHFDIVRSYDPLTGNEANTIDENAVDRQWHEREFMRVDWSSNLIEGDFAAGWGVYEFPLNYIASGSYWTNLQTRPTDPYASRFSDDYVEINDNVFLAMDLYTCAIMTGFSDAAFYDFPGPGCGFGEGKLRHSFKRVTQKSDFIPKSFPDSVVRLQDGKPIYDPDTGEVVREPLYDRFGIFRIEVPTYDDGYGTTEQGRLFRAMMFNIWQRWVNDDGRIIPVAERDPKPIVYYLNAEWPTRWRQAAAEVSDDYDNVYTKMVADAKGMTVAALQSKYGTADKPFHMYEIRDNDCNPANIRAFVSNEPDLEFAVRRVVCSDGEECGDIYAKIGLGNLENICTSLEAATLDPDTGKSRFEWQRIGDVRYNMLVWLASPQESGWGGYGPMHSDVRTGETVSATAYIRGVGYEQLAATVVDWIELINDEKSVEDVVWGQDIRRQGRKTREEVSKMLAERAGPEFVKSLDSRFQMLGSSKKDLLQEIDPNWQRTRGERIAGTKLESDYLISDFYLMMASNGSWRPGMPVTEELKKKASPLGRIFDANPLSKSQQRGRRALTNAGFCFLSHDFDPHWAGLALELKDLDRAKRFEVVGAMMLKHVFAHELGHNVGLSHNFEGSYDALNYYPGFWELYGDGTNSASPSDQVAQRMDELRNTSVMEYMSAKGAFSHALGRYDEAALRFVYVDQVQVFEDTSLVGGQSLRKWRYMNHYSKIPSYVCNGGACSTREEMAQKISARRWVAWDPQNPPSNEVPYLFCDNYYDRVTPFCATFDYGSSLQEIHSNYYSMWKDYYFFNNFSRDRLQPITWYWPMAQYPVFYAMMNVTLVNQYMYYLRSLDPNFLTTDLGQDMLTTVGQGLNMATEIMSTPEPVRMCPWPGTENPQIFIPWYYLNDCDERAALNSEYAIRNEQIQLPLGEGRPASLGFTADFVDYGIDFVGSFFDKANVLFLLGLQEPSFVRFNYELDLRSYNISLFRTFENELRDFYDRMVNLDPYLIQSDTALDFGSYWCRDKDAPTMAYLGHYEPRKMIDVALGTRAPGPSADCTNPGVIYPRLLNNMPFDAMFYAYWLFTSPMDSELDMGKSLKVFVLGADDEFPSWRNLPPEEICACTDELTGLDYRAIRQPGDIPDLGCRLVERACQAQVDYLNDESNDYYRERWRAWFERLEFARDLSRVFDR